MGVIKYYILIAVKQQRVVSVVGKGKHLSDRSQIFHLNSSESKTV